MNTVLEKLTQCSKHLEATGQVLSETHEFIRQYERLLANKELDAVRNILEKGLNLQDLSNKIDAIKAYISGPLEGWLIKPSRSGKHVGRSTIIWHLGQALAIRGGPGDGVGAVGWMKRCKDPEDSQWNNYVDATIAFLESDRAAFEENAMGENDNSSTLERLRVGWGKSYGEVY